MVSREHQSRKAMGCTGIRNCTLVDEDGECMFFAASNGKSRLSRMRLSAILGKQKYLSYKLYVDFSQLFTGRLVRSLQLVFFKYVNEIVNSTYVVIVYNHLCVFVLACNLYICVLINLFYVAFDSTLRLIFIFKTPHQDQTRYL